MIKGMLLFLLVRNNTLLDNVKKKGIAGKMKIRFKEVKFGIFGDHNFDDRKYKNLSKH